MLDEIENIKKDTEMEVESSDYMIPKKDCFNEDGTVDKYKYLLQFPNFTKHERKMTKKKIRKFLDKYANHKYFRLEIQGQPHGVNFVFEGGYISAEQQDKFYHELWDVLYGSLYEIKNFDFSDDDKSSLEIWGITDAGEPKILYLYPNAHGTIIIKKDDE